MEVVKMKIYIVTIEVSESETVVRPFANEKVAYNFFNSVVEDEIKNSSHILSFDSDARIIEMEDGYRYTWEDGLFTYGDKTDYMRDFYYAQITEEELHVDPIYLLSETDGYSIQHRVFKSHENARKHMQMRYAEVMESAFSLSSRSDEDLSEDEEYWYSISHLDEDSATAFANGDTVYVWDITELSPDDKIEG